MKVVRSRSVSYTHLDVYKRQAYADELYASYKDNRIDDTADRARLAGLLAGRKVLCLAPGGTLATHRTEVEAFIARETPVVIAAMKA